MAHRQRHLITVVSSRIDPHLYRSLLRRDRIFWPREARL